MGQVGTYLTLGSVSMSRQEEKNGKKEAAVACTVNVASRVKQTLASCCSACCVVLELHVHVSDSFSSSSQGLAVLPRCCPIVFIKAG